VTEMTKSILTPVEHGEPLDRLALDQIGMVLGAHTLQAHCGAPKFTAGPRRGLEAWQKLRTEEMLRAHLQGNLTVKELASACSLSKVTSRVASGKVLARRYISASFNFGSSEPKTCFHGPASLLWRLRCYPASVTRPPLRGASAAWST